MSLGFELFVCLLLLLVSRVTSSTELLQITKENDDQGSVKSIRDFSADDATNSSASAYNEQRYTMRNVRENMNFTSIESYELNNNNNNNNNTP
jgi:hypothetical protein